MRLSFTMVLSVAIAQSAATQTPQDQPRDRTSDAKAPPPAMAVPADEVGFVPLFDGENLTGWISRGGKAEYRAEAGCIVGQTRPNQPNSFLCTERDFADFELRYEFRVDRELNSGVQIRSHSRPEYQNGRVHGYQIEIDPSERAWTAGLYEEGRRGWLQSPADDAPSKSVFLQDGWNRVRVIAEGPRIRTWLNDVPVVDYIDHAPEAESSGFIGLQVHGVGGRTEPLEVRWRNLRIREIPGVSDTSEPSR